MDDHDFLPDRDRSLHAVWSCAAAHEADPGADLDVVKADCLGGPPFRTYWAAQTALRLGLAPGDEDPLATPVLDRVETYALARPVSSPA